MSWSASPAEAKIRETAGLFGAALIEGAFSDLDDEMIEWLQDLGRLVNTACRKVREVNQPGQAISPPDGRGLGRGRPLHS